MYKLFFVNTFFVLLFGFGVVLFFDTIDKYQNNKDGFMNNSQSIIDRGILHRVQDTLTVTETNKSYVDNNDYFVATDGRGTKCMYFVDNDDIKVGDTVFIFLVTIPAKR